VTRRWSADQTVPFVFTELGCTFSQGYSRLCLTKERWISDVRSWERTNISLTEMCLQVNSNICGVYENNGSRAFCLLWHTILQGANFTVEQSHISPWKRLLCKTRILLKTRRHFSLKYKLQPEYSANYHIWIFFPRINCCHSLWKRLKYRPTWSTILYSITMNSTAVATLLITGSALSIIVSSTENKLWTSSMQFLNLHRGS
jgi:hypothetical protein